VRRSLLSIGLGALCFGVGGRWATAAWERRSRRQQRPLRPPGSVDEPRFAGLCVRCGNCIRACPYGILAPDAGANGIGGLLAPVVRFEGEYCREDCHQCTHVCPSGAIRSLPLEKKPTAPIGLAVLDSSICLLADDRECDVCARMCPYEAIEIVWNEEEYIALPRVDPERCPGCGACQVACPGTNDWEREHADEPIPLRKAIEVHAGRR
jgi:ferredoxin-type protein NapF